MDPRSIQKHSSQSTTKAAKKTSIRGHRRIWLRGWPSNRTEVLKRVAGKPADSFVIVIKLGSNPLEDEQLEFSAFFKAWRFVKKKFSELGPVSVDWRKTSRQPTVCANRTPTQTACTDAHSVSQHILNWLTTFHHANTRDSRTGRLRIAHLCVLKQLSSTCHVSFLAAPDTDHKHKFSLTHFIHFSYLSDGLTFAHKPCDSRPMETLRCSTAEWRINTHPISHSYSRRFHVESSCCWSICTCWCSTCQQQYRDSSR